MPTPTLEHVSEINQTSQSHQPKHSHHKRYGCVRVLSFVHVLHASFARIDCAKNSVSQKKKKRPLFFTLFCRFFLIRSVADGLDRAEIAVPAIQFSPFQAQMEEKDSIQMLRGRRFRVISPRNYEMCGCNYEIWSKNRCY
ncbi:hypothetical protein AVEN_233175-1 [Araneus ventricosus]|uniref:Uncharacterized protein n=1 Tax=Araneus ventricosus TaxID=182803 RepID=A0A4Y2EJ92_ARAVE|nr:hypothetical protein AVEN_233175-1 [Araneus ventricosus]